MKNLFCNGVKYFSPEAIRLTGIYFLMVGKNIVYIGQTRDLFSRINAHLQSEKPFVKIRFIPCRVDLLNHYEKRWILRFKPFYNVAGLPKERPKYDRLKRLNKQKQAAENVLSTLGAFL